MLVTTVFLVEAFRYIVLHHRYAGLMSMQPIYNPATFNLRALAAGTSLAALVFIGFDGVSILAEEVKNPKRNVLLASVLRGVVYGAFQRSAGLHGAARLAGLHHAAKSRDGVYGCGADGQRSVSICRVRRHVAGFEHCVRTRWARGCVASALQHGARRRVAAKKYSAI